MKVNNIKSFEYRVDLLGGGIDKTTGEGIVYTLI